MASYSATMIVKSVTGKPMAGGGSFANINIDGRLGILSAAEVAREIFKKEAEFQHGEYLGFALEKTERFVAYRSPSIFDSDLKAKDILFLL